MSGPAALALATGIMLDAGLKATIPLALGGLAARLWRGSAAQRHALLASAFAASSVLPLLSALRGPAVALDAPWLLAAWAAGAAAAGLPLARSLWALARLRRASVPDPLLPGVRHSAGVGPLTWGLLRPVIVLPTASAAWPPGLQAAALAHERAHIARWDWAVHLAVWGVCVAFWFHPLAWHARRMLALEAEHAADDAVLSAGVRPSDYARLLVTLARGGVPSAALGAGASLVGQRVQAVLAHRSRSPRRWPVALVALGLGVAGLPALGGWAAWTAAPETLTCLPEPTP